MKSLIVFSVAAVLLIACARSSPTLEARALSTLYCNGLRVSYLDSTESVYVEKAALAGDRFTAWIGYAALANAWGA